MTDRELLEMAAKAAGYGGANKNNPHCWTESEYPKGSGLNGALWNYKGRMDTAELWNPLTDDGDALRLAAGLILNVLASEACIIVEDEKGVECIEYLYGPEDYTSAWRRAIVRAAAAIGKSM